MTTINIRNLEKRFATTDSEVVALRTINLSVAENEFVALVGASGCGKSTLLRIVGGLESATAGEVTVDGKTVWRPGSDRAMVFQEYSLYPWLTVSENICFPQRLKAQRTRSDNSDADSRFHTLIECMGLSNFRDSYPKRLSGGMRQRVAIARAVMSEPRILLMDEPFGALDAQTREVMHELIDYLFQIERNTILFVTHDVDEAIRLADRVVVMSTDPGEIDSVHEVPQRQPEESADAYRMNPEVVELKQAIVARIRASSDLFTDVEKLKGLRLGT